MSPGALFQTKHTTLRVGLHSYIQSSPYQLSNTLTKLWGPSLQSALETGYGHNDFVFPAIDSHRTAEAILLRQRCSAMNDTRYQQRACHRILSYILDSRSAFDILIILYR